MIDIDRDTATRGDGVWRAGHQPVDGEVRGNDADEPSWTIRPIAPADRADRADAKRLFAALHIYNAGLDPRFALSVDWGYHLDLALDRLAAGVVGMGVLTRDRYNENAIGLAFAEVHRGAPLWAMRDWLELADLYVEPAWRGTGLAAALTERVEEWGRMRAIDVVQLYVTATNERALAFYRKGGFQPAQYILRKPLPQPERGD